MLDGSQTSFFNFIDEYKSLIQKHIPGEFYFEYESRLYMAPVFRHLEEVVKAAGLQGRVLDLGCGRGHYSAYMSQRGLKVEGIEVHVPKAKDDFLHNQDPTVINKYPALFEESTGKYGFGFKYFDGKKLPFDDAVFDVVLFYASFEHIPVENIAEMTKESFRVLKPGGQAFIFRCPSSLAWKEHFTKWMGLGAHEKLYGKGEILRIVKDAGYKVERFDRSDFFPAQIPQLRIPRESLLGKILTKGQIWVNESTVFLIGFEKALKWTPLRLFFHHFEIVLSKPV